MLGLKRRPQIDRNYDALVRQMQEALATPHQQKKPQETVKREILRERLISGWEERFPGTPFTRENWEIADREINKFFDEKRASVSGQDIKKAMADSAETISGLWQILGISSFVFAVCLTALAMLISMLRITVLNFPDEGSAWNPSWLVPTVIASMIFLPLWSTLASAASCWIANRIRGKITD